MLVVFDIFFNTINAVCENTTARRGCLEQLQNLRTIAHAKKKKKFSRAWFRSTDLWVMGPARFHCATLLHGQRTRNESTRRLEQQKQGNKERKKERIKNIKNRTIQIIYIKYIYSSPSLMHFRKRTPTASMFNIIVLKF